MKKLLFYCMISLAVIATSCQKEEELTSGEQIAKELQTVIKDQKITRVVHLPAGQNWSQTYLSETYGRSFSFKGQFVFIENEYYNLNNLISYTIAERYQGAILQKYLILTFY